MGTQIFRRRSRARCARSRGCGGEKVAVFNSRCRRGSTRTDRRSRSSGKEQKGAARGETRKSRAQRSIRADCEDRKASRLSDAEAQQAAEKEEPPIGFRAGLTKLRRRRT